MTDFAPGSANGPVFLEGDGEMVRRIREHNWAATPLGPIGGWPQSLRTAVDIMLRSPGPLSVLWGPERIQFYNHAYITIAAERHPSSLGRSAAETWGDAYPSFLGPIFDRVFAGEAVTVKDQLVALGSPNGEGTLERYFTASFSPIRDEAGAVAGIFHPVTETTERVLAETAQRESEARHRFRVELSDALRGLTSPPEIRAVVAEHLGPHLGVDQANYYTIDGDRFVVTEEWRTAESPGMLGSHSVADFGEDTVARRHAGEILRLNDTQGEEGAETYAAAGMVAVLSVPLSRNGRWVAGLHVHQVQKRVWTDAEEALLSDVAERTWAEIERVRAEAELRESEARLRLALQAGRLAEVTFQIDDGAVSHSAAFAELLGHPPEKRLTLAEFRAQYHPEDHDRVLAERAAILKGNQSFYEIEKRIVRPDGKVRWLYGRGSVTRDSQGRAVSVTAVYLDETERKRTEMALRVSEERLRAIVETATDYAIFMSDVDGRIETWPKGAQEVFGWTAEEAIGQSDALIFTPEDRAQGVPDQERQSARERGQSPNVRWHLRKDGTRVFIEGMTRPLRGEGGTVTGFVKVGQDVTERREAEERLRELNGTLEARVEERTAELNRVWQNSQDLQVVVDEKGVFKAVSPAATRLLGWLPEEMVGRPLFEFTHPDGHANSDQKLAEAIAGPTETHLNRYRDKAGNYHWISWITTPAEGLIYCSGRDVTAEVERQAELEAAQEQLRQSQKLDAMGQLTGGVAHDFNNLLTPIIASLDMLLRRGLGSERERRLMDGALQSAERAKVLVQRLLAFARKQPLQPGPVDVRHLVSEMAELIASTSGPRIDVRVELSPDLPPAIADANQLEMALLNLAVNARDAMPDSGVLTISAARESVRRPHPAKLRHGHYVRLSVRDTGEGMDAPTLARAVEPFFSTKGVGRGTGLGLSMVHGLAEQLGGGLTITSSLGKGTTVDLWLPISAVALEEDGNSASTATASKATGTALLVDDEDLVRMSTADILMDLGYAVVEATSANEAMRLMDEGLAPDLVVTDHLMPGLTGLDLARDLRSRRPDLPVLIVSGYADMDGIAPGFPRLTKPFRAAEMAASLAALTADGKE